MRFLFSSLFWVCLPVLCALVSCAHTARTDYTVLPERKLAMLDSTYNALLRMTAQKPDVADADSILYMLTDSSVTWLDTLETAARYADSANVANRPFHEILAICLYRLLDRENELAQYPDHKMLRIARGYEGIMKRVTSLPLGHFEIKNDRGTRGLAQSPKVPILIFDWDDAPWKFNLYETVPLVVRGLETIGIKKDWTPSYTAIYLIEKYYHSRVWKIDDSLLSP
jgi:hypothetical protein